MEEKIALVTGGIRGIGEKISLRFLKEGYQVVRLIMMPVG